MGKIISAVVLFAGCFLIRFVLAGGYEAATGGADPNGRGLARQPTKSEAMRNAMILQLAQAVGLGGLSGAELGVLTLVATVYCYVLGVFTDVLIDERAFGRTLNGTIAFIGAFVTLYIYAAIVGQFHKEHILPLFCLCAMMSAVAIALAAAAKFWVIGATEDYMIGDYREKPNKARKVDTAAARFNRIASKRSD